MGCSNSAATEVKTPDLQKEVTNLKDTKFTHQDFVNEKRGKISADYQILQPSLGKGAFGEVYRAIHKVTQQQRAIKVIRKKLMSFEDQEMLQKEVEILKQLDHPNIITIYEFYQDREYFYIVTELCQGGELFDRIISDQHFSERKAAEVMKQLLSAVTYCHERNIAHRDLKPENILFETNHQDSLLKIADFGTSQKFDDRKMDQRVGTPYYIAPEVLDRKYTEKCDVWSCGVIMYILLCGVPPFNGEDDYQIMAAVKKGQFRFKEQEWLGISTQAKQLINKMLEKDPKRRIPALTALNDVWIQQYSTKQDVDLPSLTNVLERIKTFRIEKKMQEAALMFMVNYVATKDEKNELLKQFKALDENNDGKLSREELLNGYKKVMSDIDAEQQVELIMSEVDKDGSGSIDYSEFVYATINREKLLATEKLLMAFKMIDKDQSNYITKDEIKMAFGQNSGISEQVWKEMIQEVDQNSDGKISFDEFKSMMMKITKV